MIRFKKRFLIILRHNFRRQNISLLFHASVAATKLVIFTENCEQEVIKIYAK